MLGEYSMMGMQGGMQGDSMMGTQGGMQGDSTSLSDLDDYMWMLTDEQRQTLAMATGE
jgi:hypothetical protein